MKDIRPRFYGKGWLPIIDKLRELGLDKAKELFDSLELPEDSDKITYNSDEDTISSKGTKIKTADQLIEVGEINLEKFAIDKQIRNSWGVSGKKKVPKIHNGELYFTEEWIYSTNYQVKLWLNRRGLEEPDTSWTRKWLKELSKDINLPDKRYIAYDARPVVVAIGDLHIGAITEDSKVVPDYNKEVCRQSLLKVATILNNNYKTRPVYFIIGGDLIESFTGKNHKDTWKAIELHGAKASLEAFSALRDLFMGTKGFQKAFLVSGNHDRISSSNKDDTEGQLVELIHGIFAESTNIETVYDPLLISQDIDGIQYLITHGHQGISKKSSEQLVLDYGDNSKFNMIVEFHDHKRDMKDDKFNVRRQKIPSIVKSTRFSQQMGLNSRSGFVIFERNDVGSVDYKNIDL